MHVYSFTSVAIPTTVTFNTRDGLSSPSPDYLTLHALCCQVAWTSGAGKYVDDIQRRMDEKNVLTNDGSSAMFTNALLPLTLNTRSRLAYWISDCLPLLLPLAFTLRRTEPMLRPLL
ncbi:hypothetical protein BDN70DRAFT_89523 [Pholiota conissans]|uniref:Uncharacterized protein n=1 Tax=Pholiota conissans TaxID=109636 RepID=A0A9P5Z040_9AGAR|nr:hypothetical protein BDN70DRAFT_89523 [Pholiota conissans]